MSNWFTRLFGASGDTWPPGPTDDFWYTSVGPGSVSSAGVRVTHDGALRIAVALACVKVISEAIGQLPLVMYRRRSNGDKERVEEHPLHDLLHDQPNDEHTAVEFRELVSAHAIIRGTAFAEILPGPRGAVDQLVPLHPDHVSPVRVKDASGRTQWQLEVREPGAPKRRLMRDELFVLRAMGIRRDCPWLGLDPITVESQSLGAALAAQDYAARFFANDARPSGIIKHPGSFKDPESRNTFQRAWARAFTGANRHRTAVLEHGLEYQAIGLDNEQAQFLDTRKYLDTDICRIFRVQPHKVGILDRSTFSNIEQQSIEFVVDTLMPWLVRWEQAIKRDLILRPRFFAEHNVMGLLRGDIVNRYKAYAIGRNWGWLSANDVRRFENMNSIGDQGETYLEPRNMMPAGDPSGQGQPDAAGDQQQQDQPPPGQGGGASRTVVENRQRFKFNGRGLWLPN